MTPLYEKSLKEVRGYLGSEQVAGKRLREWVSVTDAQELLMMVRDARPAGEGLAFVRVKDEVAARPEIEGGNDEVEGRECDGLRGKNEDGRRGVSGLVRRS